MAAKSNCPWSLPVESGPATSLKDVMDEQLATNLQDKENGPLGETMVKESNLTDEELAKIISNDATDDDLMIAQMLQMQVSFNTMVCAILKIQIPAFLMHFRQN